MVRGAVVESETHGSALGQQPKPILHRGRPLENTAELLFERGHFEVVEEFARTIGYDSVVG